MTTLWTTGIHSYNTAREAAAVANQEYLDRQRAEHDYELGQAHFQAAERNRRAEWARGMREAATAFEQQRMLREHKLKQTNIALKIGKLLKDKEHNNEVRKELTKGIQY